MAATGYMPNIKIVGKPTKESLRLTEKQGHALDRLFEWEKQSAKTHWVLGGPN